MLGVTSVVSMRHWQAGNVSVSGPTQLTITSQKTVNGVQLVNLGEFDITVGDATRQDFVLGPLTACNIPADDPADIYVSAATGPASLTWFSL